LETQQEPPYFLSYEVSDEQDLLIRTSFGSLVETALDHSRLLDIDLRVGSPKLDNTHLIRGGGVSVQGGAPFVRMPLDSSPYPVRWLLWYYTDNAYKQALERLSLVRASERVKVQARDTSQDMSKEEPVQQLGALHKFSVNTSLWEDKLRRISAPFARYKEIYKAEAVLHAGVETRWYVNSEGTRIRTSQDRYTLHISAVTKADDGMELPRFESFFAPSEEELPSETAALSAVEEIIADLLAMRRAPITGPYVGPAILSGRASGVFFHEVFGHRVEGNRLKSEADGQTFKAMLGSPVLPHAFSVYFDPTLTSYAGYPLAGHYAYDNQGVAGRRVTVVNDGIFGGFLMSRTPLAGFDHSNGHGRKQPGFWPVARQSNLVVEVNNAVTSQNLKDQLIQLLRAQHLPWGLRFEDIQGGFTLTRRTIPNAFNVIPIKVFRVYVDGHEELVRGVDLIGTPLAAFSKILAADDKPAVFNGICGAESGGVPVSAVSPGILLSQIEVQKKHKSQERPPILPAPSSTPQEEQ